MSISSLFAGMEAYLDSDVEINNDTAIPEEDTVVDIERTAEVASDTADATEEAKDTEVASQMLSRMCDMYAHVKQFGIDRTFVSLYNRHGELDRVCGIQFPSCESMDVVGDRYSRYSTAFIAAMEDEKEGLWAKVKKVIAKIWNWIKNVASKIWEKIKSLFGFNKSRWQKALDFLKRNKGKIAISAGAVATLTGATIWLKRRNQSKMPAKIVQQAKTTVTILEKLLAEVQRTNGASPIDSIDSNLIKEAEESVRNLKESAEEYAEECKPPKKGEPSSESQAYSLTEQLAIKNNAGQLIFGTEADNYYASSFSSRNARSDFLSQVDRFKILTDNIVKGDYRFCSLVEKELAELKKAAENYVPSLSCPHTNALAKLILDTESTLGKLNQLSLKASCVAVSKSRRILTYILTGIGGEPIKLSSKGAKDEKEMNESRQAVSDLLKSESITKISDAYNEAIRNNEMYS